MKDRKVESLRHGWGGNPKLRKIAMDEKTANSLEENLVPQKYGNNYNPEEDYQLFKLIEEKND